MIPAVVLVLALVAPVFTLPLTTQEYTPTGVQGSTGVQGVEQITGQVNPIIQDVEKTGVQGTPVVSTETKYTEVGTFTPVESYTGGQLENTPLTKTQIEPVGSEQSQQTYSERPVLLPVQPLSVVPVGQVGQVLRPIVVPADAITTGRIIIMTVEPIGQRVFQQEVTNVGEKQTPYQQSADYTTGLTQVVEPNQQTYNVQPEDPVKIVGNVETPYSQTAQNQLTGYTPEQTFKTFEGQGQGQTVESGQQTTVQEQTATGTYTYEKQGIPTGIFGHTPVQTQTAGINHETYHTTQGVRTLLTDNVEKHTPQQTSYNYNPVQAQVGEQYQQQQQQYQHSAPVTDYTPVRTQSVESVQQQNPVNFQQVVPETVQKQQTVGQFTPVHTQSVQSQQTYNTETGITGRQALTGSEHVPTQTQLVEPTQYNTQTVGVTGNIEKQGFNQQPAGEFVQSVQQPYNVQPVAPYQQPLEHVQQVQPQSVGSVQKQTYSIEPNTQQTAGYTPGQTSRISEVPQQFNVQPAPANTFVEQVPHYESVQPSTPIQTLSAVPYQGEQSVKPSSVVSS